MRETECQELKFGPFELYPEETACRYRERGYWVEETIPQFLRQACERYENREAVVGLSHERHFQSSTLGESLPGEKGLVDHYVRLTYRELGDKGQAAAQRLVAVGVRPGDRVLLQLGNTVEFLVYLLGTFWAGALPIFCLPQHREQELLHFARKAHPVAHIFSGAAEQGELGRVHQRCADQLSAEGFAPLLTIDVQEPLSGKKGLEPVAGAAYNTYSPRASEQIAFLQLSGGTTGASKLIPRTHADYLYSVRESAKICRLSEADRTLIALPCAHNFTMSSPGILGALFVGSTLVMADNPSPQTSFAMVEAERITHVALVPPLAQAWLASARRRNPDLSSLRLMQVGGSKLSAAVAQDILSYFGCQLQQVFGMAEGLVNYTRWDDSLDTIVTTQGRPISPDDEILVVDEEDRPVEPGEAGHLLTRGPYTIRGYFSEEAVNQYSFTDEGFYRTGDIVRRRDDGNLEVLGRSKDQINRGGEKIAVDEVENLMLGHPLVHDAVVLGLPDDLMGERVAIVVVPHAGAGPELNPINVQDYLRRKGLAAFKIPEYVKILDQLPLTHIGKISRRDLRSTLKEVFMKGNPHDH